jgi:hypothetical protein
VANAENAGAIFGQKKVSKEKATRNSANFLRFLLLARVFGRAIPGPPKTSGILAAPLRAILAKSCDARGEITGVTPSRLKSSLVYLIFYWS